MIPLIQISESNAMRKKKSDKQKLLWGALMVLIIASAVMVWGLQSSKHDAPRLNIEQGQALSRSVVIADEEVENSNQNPMPVMLAGTSVSSIEKSSQSSSRKVSMLLARSPYPKSGEIFSKPIPPKLLADPADFANGSAGQLIAKPGEIIPWNHARKYVDQTITVEGTIVLANHKKNVCFLNFTKDWKGRFYVIMFKKTLVGWPESPEKYFLNKTVHITGKVVNRKGTPQIQVTDARQIKVVK